jgi:hypothetical protein
MLRAAVRVPAEDGSNVTLTVQLLLPARLDPQVFVFAKSEALLPVRLRLVIAMAAVLPFVIVTGCGELVVPTVWAANVSEAGDTVIAVNPVPDTAMFCGLPTALSAKVINALRAPIPAGSNVTVIVQLSLLFKLAGHVFVCVKSPGFVPVTVIETTVSRVVAEFVSVTVFDALGFR